MGVVKAVGETGGVGEQVPNLYRFFERFGHRFQGRSAAINAGVGEGRDETAHRILEFESAFLVQHHRGHGGDGLGHRVDAKQGVVLDGLAGFHIALAVPAEMGDLAGPTDQDQPAGQQSIIHVAGEIGINSGESLGVETDVSGIDFDLEFRHGCVPSLQCISGSCIVPRSARLIHRDGHDGTGLNRNGSAKVSIESR